MGNGKSQKVWNISHINNPIQCGEEDVFDAITLNIQIDSNILKAIVEGHCSHPVWYWPQVEQSLIIILYPLFSANTVRNTRLFCIFNPSPKVNMSSLTDPCRISNTPLEHRIVMALLTRTRSRCECDGGRHFRS